MRVVYQEGGRFLNSFGFGAGFSLELAFQVVVVGGRGHTYNDFVDRVLGNFSRVKTF